MKTKEFNFNLPEHLIAQYPPKERGKSRLMVLDRDSGSIKHLLMSDFADVLKEEKPLLVFNDTKVRKARIIGKSEDTGKEEEFLLLSSNERELTRIENISWKAMVKRVKRKKIGQKYIFNDLKAEITEFTDDGYIILKFDSPITDHWLENNGHIPLPPYIKRKDEDEDSDRYQTIYAKQIGSVAAPTAGLHFTEEILNKLNNYGIESASITLHVGLGTFLPVRSENIEDHIMHEEKFFITDKNAQKIEKAKEESRKIIAVGTTSLRTLESAFIENKLNIGEQSTSIFIYPGYKFKIVDSLFTNFHTPESTLLMLVSAFAGRDLIFKSYEEAVKMEYKFFSYGDAMLIK